MRYSDFLVRSEAVDEFGDYLFDEQRYLSEEIARAKALNSRLLFIWPLRRLRLGAALAAWVGVFALPLALATSGFSTFGSVANESLFLAAFTLLGFSCVQLAYESFVEHRWQICRMIGAGSDCEAIRHFVVGIFSPVPQWLFALVTLSWAAILALLLLALDRGPVDALILVWWLFAVGILTGNGVYWAIITPLFVRRVSGVRSLILDPLSPASTPGLPPVPE